jgi:hypothetical protein
VRHSAALHNLDLAIPGAVTQCRSRLAGLLGRLSASFHPPSASLPPFDYTYSIINSNRPAVGIIESSIASLSPCCRSLQPPAIQWLNPLSPSLGNVVVYLYIHSRHHRKAFFDQPSPLLASHPIIRISQANVESAKPPWVVASNLRHAFTTSSGLHLTITPTASPRLLA